MGRLPWYPLRVVDGARAPVEKPRSNGVTAVGALMISFGALGLLSAPATFFTRQLGAATGSGKIQEVLWSGVLGTWMVVSLSLGALLSVLLLTSGIGVLRRSRWARRASLAYGVAALVLGALGQFVAVFYMYPALAPFIESGSVVDRSGAIGGIVGGVVGGIVGMALPIAVIVVMTRPSFKAELDG